MNVEIETEAPKFLFKEYFFEFWYCVFAVQWLNVCSENSKEQILSKETFRKIPFQQLHFQDVPYLSIPLTFSW
jgi:hypothetical protein